MNLSTAQRYAHKHGYHIKRVGVSYEDGKPIERYHNGKLHYSTGWYALYSYRSYQPHHYGYRRSLEEVVAWIDSIGRCKHTLSDEKYKEHLAELAAYDAAYGDD